MSDTKWISLHNAALRIIEKEKVKSDYQWILHGWPEFDVSDEKLVAFMIAAQNDDINARGYLSKGLFFHSRKTITSDNKSKKIYKGMHSVSKIVDHINMIWLPFIEKLAHEKKKSPISSSFWREFSQIWRMNQLIDIHFDLDSIRAKKLQSNAQLQLNAEESKFKDSRSRNYEDSQLIEFVFYNNVEIEVESLERWQSKPANLSLHSLQLAKTDIKLPPKRIPLAERSDEWALIVKHLDGFLKYLETNTPPNFKQKKFKSFPKFLHAYCQYLKQTNPNFKFALSPNTFRTGVIGRPENKYGYISYADPIYRKILPYISTSYSPTRRPETTKDESSR